MNNFKEKIEKICFENKISKDLFAKQIGRTRQWLNTVGTTNKLWVSDLEKISKVGKVQMSYWWDEKGSDTDDISEDNRRMKNQIDDLIEDKRRMRKEIDELNDKLGLRKATG